MPAALRALLLAPPLAACLPEVFGRPGASSPVPPDTARYMLDLERQDIYLHYCGDGQLFSLRLSPALARHLESVAGPGGMPSFYGVGDLTEQGTFDWGASTVPTWSGGARADARHVFYGREVRGAGGALYGNAIHLSLGPEEDPEGWTAEEVEENRKFAEAIRQGMPVGDADAAYRQFRSGIAAKLPAGFADRFGAGVTTKAHRFAWQMYTAESQQESLKPGRLFFEMFPGGEPPTSTVPFLEAEDGCKGTPTPSARAPELLGESAAPAGQALPAAAPAAAAAAAAAAAGAAVLGLAAAVLRAWPPQGWHAGRLRPGAPPPRPPPACE